MKRPGQDCVREPPVQVLSCDLTLDKGQHSAESHFPPLYQSGRRTTRTGQLPRLTNSQRLAGRTARSSRPLTSWTVSYELISKHMGSGKSNFIYSIICCGKPAYGSGDRQVADSTTTLLRFTCASNQNQIMKQEFASRCP